MKAASPFCCFTRLIAWVSVPGVSGFGGFLKPIWLSLICTKLSPLAGVAACAEPSRLDRGTPPATVQSTPAPAPTMHSRTPRRLAWEGEVISGIVLSCASISISGKWLRGIDRGWRPFIRGRGGDTSCHQLNEVPSAISWDCTLLLNGLPPGDAVVTPWPVLKLKP